MESDRRETALERLLARLEQLEEEVGTLRAARAAQPADAGPAARQGACPAERTNRRGLLKVALGAAAATMGAGALLEQQTGTALAATQGQTTFTSATSTPTVTIQNTGTGLGLLTTNRVFLGPTTVTALTASGPVSGRSTTASAAVSGTNLSTAASAIGTLGVISSTTPGAGSAAVWGRNNGTTSNGIGVYGSHAGGGTGVYGTAAGPGTGVVGIAFGTGYGVTGTGYVGVVATGTLGGDFFGDLTAGSNHYGVYAEGDIGVYGSGTTYGGKFYGGPSPSVGVYGNGFINGGSFYADATANSFNMGVYGNGDVGVGGYGATWAGYFYGSVNVLGTLVKAGGSFKIDHPLDPAHKYLSHSFVESPDMLNIYNGTAVLDAAGQAVVPLPAWFGALNRDYRYQLTPIGATTAVLYIAQEVADNQFTIAGGTPGLKVSWQVTGIRQDPWANDHRIPVEEDKPAGEQGAYLYPQGYGALEDRGIGALHMPPAPRAATPPARPVRPNAPTPPVPADQ
jgi:hypothetical protein